MLRWVLVSDVSTTRSAEPQRHQRDRPDGIRPLWGLVAGLFIGLLVFAIPLYASVSYRLAVGSLHRELAEIEIESADLVEEYISSCYESLAPASIRIYRPVDGVDLHRVRTDYLVALKERGFDDGYTQSSRERGDSLDADTVRFVSDETANTLTVIGDVYDIDMVGCIPLTGRS